MTGIHYDILMYIGDHPESGRVVYLDTFTGPNAMSECRTRFHKRVGQIEALFEHGHSAIITNRGGLHRAVMQSRLGLYGEADVTVQMEYREEEDG